MRFCSHLFPNIKSQRILFIPLHNGSFHLQFEALSKRNSTFQPIRTTVFSNSWWMTLKTDCGRRKQYLTLSSILPQITSNPINSNSAIIFMLYQQKLSHIPEAIRYRSYQSFKVSAQIVMLKNCIGKVSTLQWQHLTWSFL